MLLSLYLLFLGIAAFFIIYGRTTRQTFISLIGWALTFALGSILLGTGDYGFGVQIRTGETLAAGVTTYDYTFITNTFFAMWLMTGSFLSFTHEIITGLKK